MSSPFHEGELAVQERAGSLTQGQNSGRMVADAIIPGAIKFVSKQPMFVAGSVDNEQRLWASIVVGESGFLSAEPQSLDVDLSRAVRNEGDPLWRNIRSNSRVGLLVIDLRTRARLRVNGRVEEPSVNQLRVAVEQAYPNCPQYIQRRSYRPAADAVAAAPIGTRGNELTEEQARWISRADTFFVASEHPSGGVDASHRGGNPGFVQVVGRAELLIPDYAGNGMFNTLGNIVVNPRVGIVIPDFESGRALQMSGRAEVLWDVEDPHGATGGTRRYWKYSIDHWLQHDGALPGTAEFLDYSPLNPSTAA